MVARHVWIDEPRRYIRKTKLSPTILEYSTKTQKSIDGLDEILGWIYEHPINPINENEDQRWLGNDNLKKYPIQLGKETH